MQDALRLCCCTFYFCFLLCSAAVTQFPPQGSINIIFSLYQHPQTQRMCRNLSRWQTRWKANMDNIDRLFLFLSLFLLFYFLHFLNDISEALGVRLLHENVILITFSLISTLFKNSGRPRQAQTHINLPKKSKDKSNLCVTILFPLLSSLVIVCDVSNLWTLTARDYPSVYSTTTSYSSKSVLQWLSADT